MAAYKLNKLGPWQDRWDCPTFKQLKDASPEHARPQLKGLIEQADGFELADWRIRWQGPSWRWTIQVLLGDKKASKSNGDDRARILAYIVPGEEGLTICVPLKEPAIRSLPKKRLTKYIREGVRLAKVSVDIRWATWKPVTDSDVHQIMDLIKRNYNFRVGKK